MKQTTARKLKARTDASVLSALVATRDGCSKMRGFSASERQLAESTGLDRGTVRRCLKRLIRKGVIRRWRQRNDAGTARWEVPVNAPVGAFRNDTSDTVDTDAPSTCSSNYPGTVTTPDTDDDYSSAYVSVPVEPDQATGQRITSNEMMLGATASPRVAPPCDAGHSVSFLHEYLARKVLPLFAPYWNGSGLGVNARPVFEVLATHGPSTVAELVRATQLGRTSVVRAIAKLELAGLAEAAGRQRRVALPLDTALGIVTGLSDERRYEAQKRARADRARYVGSAAQRSKQRRSEAAMRHAGGFGGAPRPQSSGREVAAPSKLFCPHLTWFSDEQRRFVATYESEGGLRAVTAQHGDVAAQWVADILASRRNKHRVPQNSALGAGISGSGCQ